MSNIINFVGRKIGRLTVLKMDGYWVSKSGKTKNIYWLCKCDCGVEKRIRAGKLLDGSTLSCGCLRLENSKMPCTEAGGAGKRNLYTTYMCRARRLKITFTLSFERFIELTSENCHYCGSEPSNVHTPRDRHELATAHGVYVYNGLDRMIPSDVYIEGNSLPCCRSCNIAKSDMPYEQFLELVKRIYLKTVKPYMENLLIA